MFLTFPNFAMKEQVEQEVDSRQPTFVSLSNDPIVTNGNSVKIVKTVAHPTTSSITSKSVVVKKSVVVTNNIQVFNYTFLATVPKKLDHFTN